MKEKIDEFFDYLIRYVLDEKSRESGAEKVSIPRILHARDMVTDEIGKIEK